MKPLQGYYERELTILPSLCDATAKLGVPDAFALFMDIATEHAEALGIGMNGLMKDGLFWLTVRTRIRFIDRPALPERVIVRTWPETPERSRCNRDYVLLRDGRIIVEGKTEWMIMNMKTGRLFPVDGVFPKDLELPEDRVLPEPFMRMTDDFDTAQTLGTYTVRSTDIDLGGHMNNAAYVRAIAGMFSSRDWQALDIHEMEVAFRSPCFEGDRLDLQRRDGPEGVDLRLSRDGKTVILARIKS